MQLKIQRSQRMGGVLGNAVIFCLDVRAAYAAEEAANIAKYKLGREVIYNSEATRRHLTNMNAHIDRFESDNLKDKAVGLVKGMASLAMAKMNLTVSVGSLGRGHHIECKDLPELLEAEETIMDMCRKLKQFLAAAASFDGSIILVDFDDGEKVHVSHGALQLEALPAPGAAATVDYSALFPYAGAFGDIKLAFNDVQFTSIQDFLHSLSRALHKLYSTRPILALFGLPGVILLVIYLAYHIL
jgi:hypothetical protein